MSNLKKHGRLTLIIGSIFVILSPILFTYFYTGYTFDLNSSIVGNSIGGITAPFTSLLGSILLFLALVAQVNANEQIQKQLDNDKTEKAEDRIYDQINNDLKNLEYNFDNFQYAFEPNLMASNQTDVSESRGIIALYHYSKSREFKNFEGSHEESCLHHKITLANINGLLVSFQLLGNKIKKSNINKEDKSYLSAKYQLLYASKFLTPLNHLLLADKSQDSICKVCNHRHDKIPGTIYERLVPLDVLIKELNPSIAGN